MVIFHWLVDFSNSTVHSQSIGTISSADTLNNGTKGTLRARTFYHEARVIRKNTFLG